MKKKKRILEANEIVSLSGDALASVTGGCGGSMCFIFCSPVAPQTEVLTCPDALHGGGPEVPTPGAPG